jgi:hypothetical protein
MIPTGSFVGGQLELEQFGISLDFLAGDLCLLFTWLVKHRIADFNGAFAFSSSNSPLRFTRTDSGLAGTRHGLIFFWHHWALELGEKDADWERLKAGLGVRWGKTKEAERAKRRGDDEAKRLGVKRSRKSGQSQALAGKENIEPTETRAGWGRSWYGRK